MLGSGNCSQILANETNIMRIKRDIQAKVKERVDKNQREYLLREQLKYIREELGEDNTFSDAEHFEEQLAGLEADEDIKEKIAKEISRFKNVGQNNSEGAVVAAILRRCCLCPGTICPRTTPISAMPERCWTRITMAWRR